MSVYVAQSVEEILDTCRLTPADQAKSVTLQVARCYLSELPWCSRCFCAMSLHVNSSGDRGRQRF